MPEVLLESIALGSEQVEIDEVNAVIRGVRLLGSTSRNNRRYSPLSLDDSVRLSRNRPVYLESHVDDGEKKPLARNGAITNPRRNGDANVGDWQLMKSHPTTPLILETAARFPANFALSHEVRDYDAEVSDDGILEVSRIKDLGDYALVCEGGTNRSLFEELQKMEIKTVAELKAQYPKLTEELASRELEASEEGRKQLQAEIAMLLAKVEEHKQELESLKAKLQEYTDREEYQKKKDEILASATEIVGEGFQVSQQLLGTLMKLDDAGYKQCFTEIANARSQIQKSVAKPESTSGTAGNGEFQPVNRIGRVNRR